MRIGAALPPWLTWPAAAVVGWAVVAGVVVWVPLALAALAVAGLLLWCTGQRPVEWAEPATCSRTHGEVRAFLAPSA